MSPPTLAELRKFVAPEIVFGTGARRLAPIYARNLGARRPLLVTDPGVTASGWVASVQEAFSDQNLDVTTFDRVTPNPTDEQVHDGVKVYLENDCDVVVVVGGGSPMDCAKGIAIVASNRGGIRDYEGADRIPFPGPPLVCVPTTAGTAADVSQFAIITNTSTRCKMAIVSKAAVPDVALVDPEVTTTMNAELTAHTGLDALCHAVEALASNASSPMTDLFALDAMPKIFAHLPDAQRSPLDLAHREPMMLASLHAGLAFSNASLGAVHALAHALGGLLDLPHGACNAILLPHVMRYNLDAAREPYRRIATAIGVNADDPDALLNAFFDLAERVGVTGGLSSFGVERAMLGDLSEAAMNDACIVTNPRRPTAAELEEVLAQAL